MQIPSHNFIVFPNENRMNRRLEDAMLLSLLHRYLIHYLSPPDFLLHNNETLYLFEYLTIVFFKIVCKREVLKKCFEILKLIII
jgi:hypothetical protein